MNKRAYQNYHFDLLKRKLFVLFFIISFFYSSQHIKADWVQVNNGLNQHNVNALTVTGNYIFAGTISVGGVGGIFYSTDNGNTWILTSYSNTSLALASNGSNIYTGYQNGLAYSTNYGATWLPGNLGQWVKCIIVNGATLYAGCFSPVQNSTNKGVWVSTNGSASWTQTSLNNVDIYAMTLTGNYLFATGYTSGIAAGVFRSTDNGQNWTNTLPISGNVLVTDGSFVYMGGGSVYQSTNFGANWIQTSLTNVSIQALALQSNSIFAGTGYGVYVSNDNAGTWVLRTEGMNAYVLSLAVLGGFIFAGTDGFGIYRRPLSELTGVSQISENVPLKNKLEQNYPNPFNPTSRIKFSVPKRSFVELRIFDILGRLKDLALSQYVNASEYELTLDCSAYSSGTYFYQLTADGNIIDTKKMVVLK